MKTKKVMFFSSSTASSASQSRLYNPSNRLHLCPRTQLLNDTTTVLTLSTYSQSITRPQSRKVHPSFQRNAVSSDEGVDKTFCDTYL